MSFNVESVLEPQVDGAGLGGIALIQRRLERSYRKDYDVDSGEGPMEWPQRFDLSTWGFLSPVTN